MLAAAASSASGVQRRPLSQSSPARRAGPRGRGPRVGPSRDPRPSLGARAAAAALRALALRSRSAGFAGSGAPARRSAKGFAGGTTTGGTAWSTRYQARRPRVQPAKELSVPVILRNTGALAWQPRAPRPTRSQLPLGASADGRRCAPVRCFDGDRTVLPTTSVPERSTAWSPRCGRRPRRDCIGCLGTWSRRTSLVQRARQPTARAVVEVPGAGPSLHARYLSRSPAPRRSPVRALERHRGPLSSAPKPRDGSGQFPASIRGGAPSAAAGSGDYTDTRIHANSLYFETLANLGIAGLAGLAGLAVALRRSLRRRGTGLRRGPRERGGGRGVLRARRARLLLRIHAALGSLLGTLGLTAAFESATARSRALQGSKR